MGFAVGDDADQGVAVAATGPTNALLEVGGAGGHRAEEHRGEIANVNAHL